MKWLTDFLFVILVFIIIIIILYIIGVYRSPYVPPPVCKYSELKKILKNGDVLLFKSSNIIAKIAQSVDPTPFFHMAVVCVGPDGNIFLIETDNSKAIRRDGTFFVDFENKLNHYPNSELALLRLKTPENVNITYEKLLELFVKYSNKFRFQKKPQAWLRMLLRTNFYHNLISESNNLLCIEQVSLLYRDLGIFDKNTNIHMLCPSKYYTKNLPFNKGYSFDGPYVFIFDKHI